MYSAYNGCVCWCTTYSNTIKSLLLFMCIVCSTRIAYLLNFMLDIKWLENNQFQVRRGNFHYIKYVASQNLLFNQYIQDQNRFVFFCSFSFSFFSWVSSSSCNKNSINTLKIIFYTFSSCLDLITLF